MNLIDHVKHLRFVHFSLVIACVTFSVFLSANKDEVSDRAIKDIDSIIQLYEQPDGILSANDWFDDYVRDVIPKKLKTKLDIPTIIYVKLPGVTEESNDRKQKHDTKIEYKQYELILEQTYSLTDKSLDTTLYPWSRVRDDDAIEFDPSTISKWAEFWDGLQMKRIIFVPVNFPERVQQAVITAKHIDYIMRKGKIDETYKTLYGEKDWTLDWPPVYEDIEYSLVADTALIAKSSRRLLLAPLSASDPARQLGATHAFMTRQPGSAELLNSIFSEDILIPIFRIPVKAKAISIDPQTYLSRHVGQDWIPGSFEKSFPALNSLTQGLRGLPIEQTKTLLNNVKKQHKLAEENIEVASIKIPAQLFSTWGTVIILGLQLYFLLHLRILRIRISPENEAWNYPWIALYPDLLSRLTYFVSVILFPTTIIIFLLQLQYSMKDILHVKPPISAVIFGLSTSLAIASLLTTAKLWRSKKH